MENITFGIKPELSTHKSGLIFNDKNLFIKFKKSGKNVWYFARKIFKYIKFEIRSNQKVKENTTINNNTNGVSKMLKSDLENLGLENVLLTKHVL